MAKSNQLVICVSNTGYEADLDLRKIYVRIADTAATRRGYVRVVDDSGDDYLYPEAMFVAVELPTNIKRAVLQAAA